MALGEGCSLEIIAICRNPRGGGPWFRPDGSIWEHPPVEILKLDKPKPLASPRATHAPENEYIVYYEFRTPKGESVRSSQLGWSPNTIGFEHPSKLSLRRVADGQPIHSFEYFALQEPTDTIDLTAKITLTSAKWEPLAVYNRVKTRELHEGMDVVFSPPRYDKKAKRYVMDVTHNIPRSDHALRLMAHLKNGERKEVDFHPGTFSGIPADGYALIYPDDFNIEYVKEYVLERTPWLLGEMKGISLQLDIGY